MPSSQPTVTRHERILVVDEKNMFRIWLEEKVARREMTSAEADKMLQDQEGQGKLWAGPFKDGLGNSRILYKLARDFASWKGARVTFSKSRAGHELVTFKGWPADRKLISGTRYRTDNPKMIELQIGKPGIRAAAKESARFGLYLVVAVDVADYLMRDNSSLGQLLGSLTVDIPSVLIASAIGAAAGSAIAGTGVAGLAVIGGMALGPIAVAFVVGLGVSWLLFKADDSFKITETLSRVYDEGLQKLRAAWDALGQEADLRFRQLANSHLVHDLRQDAEALSKKIGRQADWVRGEMAYLW